MNIDSLTAGNNPRSADGALHDYLHSERVKAEQQLATLHQEVERYERIVRATSAALDQMPELAQPVPFKPQDYAPQKAQTGVGYS